jgi:hypothetical protein
MWLPAVLLEVPEDVAVEANRALAEAFLKAARAFVFCTGGMGHWAAELCRPPLAREKL